MWLLEQSVAKTLETSREAAKKPTSEQQAAFDKSFVSMVAAGGDRILSLAGDKAEITVKGVLTKSPSFLAWIFGGGNTTYSEIIGALASADKDPSVSEIVLSIDSPGGQVAGLFDALAAIQGTEKPIRAVVTDMAASAAYAIAAQADEIIAGNKASQVGSVGVVVDYYVSENSVSITSTEAPKKRPDVSTEEGKEMVREELDAFHELFVEAISEGRSKAVGKKISVKKVNSDFGRGAMLLAAQAKELGMIDGIQGQEEASIRVINKKEASASVSQVNSEEEMDLETLKMKHPAVYQAARQDGIATERDRVAAHMTMGQASGDMSTAAKAIEDGSEMTALIQAKYMSAGMKKTDRQNRAEDGIEATDALDGIQSASSPLDGKESEADAVASAVCEQLGIEVEA